MHIESKALRLLYLNQIYVIHKSCICDEKLFEFGVGTDLLSDLLKKGEFEVSTLDIDLDQHPD